MLKCNGIKIFKTPLQASYINVLEVRCSERNVCCIWNSNKQKNKKKIKTSKING